MKMAYTDSCTYPKQCTFIEFDSCDCVIHEHSGYESEEERNYADENGYDAYKPCKYYLNWEKAIEILIDHVDKDCIEE